MIYGCIGEHLPHSFSKEIHNKIGGYDYALREIPKGGLDAFMREKDFRAINVTIPYKQDVIPYLDEIDSGAKAIGAVNTIVNKGGKLFGYNTDFYGMTALIEKLGIDLSNKKVLVLGTGGTSKTANAVAKALGACEIVTVSRSAGEGRVTYEEALSLHTDAQVIINTTPCGMFPEISGMPIDISGFSALEGVIDAVYNPLRTNLVSAAKARGIKAEGGLYMLVAQAVKAYEFFFDTEAESNLSGRIFAELSAEKENIVLTGMPASGKTTVGRIIASDLGRELIDTDDLIVKKYGEPITDIFAKYGEDEFRRRETEVIAEVAKLSGAVISTGGGAVLREENIKLLKMNGRIYFRDRELKYLLPTSDRPLALSREDIRKRFEERYDIYVSTADEVIRTEDDAKAAALEIERRHRR